MKNHIFLTTSIFLIFLLTNIAYGQKTDSVKVTQEEQYLVKELAIPEKIAAQVVTIMNDYKVAANLLVNDKTITQEELRTRFDVLIDEKNSKLEKILAEPQLQKMIPTTERKNKSN